MKKLSEMDPNLAAKKVLEDDMVYMNAESPPFQIYGAADVGKYGYRRMLPERAEAVSEGVANLTRCTSGIRVRFSTDSPYIALRCRLETMGQMSIMPLLGTSGFDLYEDNPDGKESRFHHAFIQPEHMGLTYESIIPVGAGTMRYYTIHFPLYAGVASLEIGLARNASVGGGAPYPHSLPLVFYGSSITMGGCVSRPGNAYPAFLSRMLQTDFINLGFAGNAKGEPVMAEYLADMAMRLLVLDYDHNAPTPDFLRETHQPFFLRFREKQPDLPVVIVTRPDFDADKEDSRLRREIIRATYDSAVAAGDRNVYFIDGQLLFEDDCRTDCTVDGVHPNDFGAYRIACGMRLLLSQLLKKGKD